jgi:nudix-type nucleoside diphosphatase (YffH/AdpP family)
MSLADRIRVRDVTTLSDDKYVLKKATFDWKRSDGTWQTVSREVYDRGDAAALLPYDKTRRTVLLTRQFRYPAYVNGADELLIEAAAGLLDDADPAARIRREVEEELGYRLKKVRPVLACFMSPGAVTERLHLFVAEYDASLRIGAGGGLKAEGEDIEVLELGFDEALAMVASGAIQDAKTIILLQHAALHIFAQAAAARGQAPPELKPRSASSDVASGSRAPRPARRSRP